jgi:uncharacterized protein
VEAAMALKDRFSASLKAAMKARDPKRLGAIRLMMAAVQQQEIANRNENLSDEEIVAVLARMVKQREESAAAYEQGNRPELAQAERDEIAVIREFMPRQLSDDKIRTAVNDALTSTGARSIKDMGKVMGALKASHAGKMDFAKAGALVKELLATPKA